MDELASIIERDDQVKAILHKNDALITIPGVASKYACNKTVLSNRSYGNISLSPQVNNTYVNRSFIQ